MMALNAYRNTERMMASAYPGCGVSWNLLAGIGRIESMHANGGATDASGSAVRPIYGPALDGTLPGNEVIELSRTTKRVVYARAIGPMQFLPGTWSRYASDGNGDGKADVQNVFDASLAAARYLCSGGLNLRDQSQVMTAILRYNNSVAYARNVLGWAAAYATGVVPVDLPPITGPIPPIADVHLDNYQGLGPGLPLNALGLPANDPLALVPLVDMGRTDVASQIPTTANGPVFAAAVRCRRVADDGAAGSAAAEPATGMPPPPQNLPHRDAAAAAAEPATVDAAAAAAEPATMDAAATAEPATMDAAATAEPATVDAAAAAAEPATVDAAAAAAELRGVLPGYEPAPAGTAAAAAGGTAAGCRRAAGSPGRDPSAAGRRNSASATGRRAGDDACTACTAGSWTGARPGRLTGTAPAGESTHLTPPTLGGDVRASH
jgi:hypothetical protein